MRDELGRFVKGHNSEGFQKGHKPTSGFKKGSIPWNKGIKCPRLSTGQLGEKNHSWKGGKWQDKNGYIYILRHNHPFHNNSGYVYEHRLVMEKYLRRYLTKEEVVHHKNEITNDNRIKNLRLFPNKNEHKRYHNLNPKKSISIKKRIMSFILNMFGLNKKNKKWKK